MSKTIAIIPCHMASKRFPGKPMKKIHGFPMFEHVYRRALLIKSIDDVYIASCDQIIFNYCLKNNIKYIGTNNTHINGTSRVSEAINKIGNFYSNILILQGDEPLINTSEIEKFLIKVRNNKNKSNFNFISRLNSLEQLKDESIVKCKILDNQIVDFYRSCSDKSINNYYKVLGIYFLNVELLKNWNKIKESYKEKKLKVEQLRILEGHYSLGYFITKDNEGSVNYANDLAKVIKLIKSNPLEQKIFKNCFSISYTL